MTRPSSYPFTTSGTCWVCSALSDGYIKGQGIDFVGGWPGGKKYARHEVSPGVLCPMSGLSKYTTEEEQLSRFVRPVLRQREIVAAVTSGPVLAAIVDAVLAALDAKHEDSK